MSCACWHSATALAAHALAAVFAAAFIALPVSVAVWCPRGVVDMWAATVFAVHTAVLASVRHVVLMVLASCLVVSCFVSYRGWCSAFVLRVAVALLHLVYCMICVTMPLHAPSSLVSLLYCIMVTMAAIVYMYVRIVIRRALAIALTIPPRVCCVAVHPSAAAL